MEFIFRANVIKKVVSIRRNGKEVLIRNGYT